MSFAKTPGTPVGGGTVHPGGSVADPELATLLKQYKRGVASRYKGLRRSELEEVQPGGIHVSPKIDGELWFMVPNEGAVVLASHNGRVLQGNIALLTEAAATFGARAGAGAVIAGELFAVGRKPRARVGDVARCLGSSGDSKLLGFQAFDLVRMPDGEPPPESYAERLALFQEWLEGGKRVQAVKTEVVGDHAAIEERYDTWVASGKAEGVIARAANGRIYKIKPEFTIDCAVLGFTERTEDPGQARSLLLGLFREDGSVQVVSSCGNLGTAERRSALHAALVDTVVPSQFRRVSHSGAMFRLVKPTMVVEVKCTDAAAEDGAGEPIRQWTLRLDGEHGWIQVAPVPGAYLLYPVLERIRDDKEPNALDARIGQLLERCLVHELDRAVEAPTMPLSEITRREVYTKVTKGATAVRKLLVWRTHKHDVDSDFPAWVVHFTDYSAGRKEPLQREVRLAPTEAAATALADAMIAAKIKRGWNPVEA